jgi:hemerythrin-like domain-containing protein
MKGGSIEEVDMKQIEIASQGGTTTGRKTGARRLAVNAAFLKDIKDDNQDLKGLLDQIIPITHHQQTATNHWPELITLLSDLRDQLALHFSLEEAYGYFDDAVVSTPELSVTAEVLRSEHPRLFADIRDLADQVTEICSDRPEQVNVFIQRFGAFQRAFEIHEERELKLILDSLDDDLGVGD